MRKATKILVFVVVLVPLISIYSNFFHHRLFFSKPRLFNIDTLFLRKGKDIRFFSEGRLLKGKVVTNAPAGVKVPLVVFCVGSAESSFASNYSKMLDTLFLQNLPMDSIAILYFDKRGIGLSQGSWYDTNFEQRAADAKAAADYAKSLVFVDTSKIALVGHSQGGWIVQVGLAKYPETFCAGLSMAGATFGVRRQLENDYTSELICKEGLDTEMAEKKATQKVARDVALASFFPLRQNWRQLKVIKDFEPSAYLKQVKAPLLLMFGENDALVNPLWCKKALALTFNNHIPPNFDTVTIRGANHSFKTAGLCGKGSSPVAYSSDCKAVLAAWIRKLYH